MNPDRCPRNRKGKRNPFCPLYAVCLDEAAKKFWLHLDCSGCEYRSRRDFTLDVSGFESSDPFADYPLHYGTGTRVWQ